MNTPRHPIPAWVTRGKTVRELIKELASFENQDAEVRLSLDYGDSKHVISIVENHDGCCVLVNCEGYYNTGWQEFMDRDKSTD